MDTITARHPDIHPSYRKKENPTGRPTPSGQKCPPPAGDITPILELSPYHPARWYLENYRKFDIQRLTDIFRHNGGPRTWQGRGLERVSDDGLNKFGLHPHTFKWDLVGDPGSPCAGVDACESVRPD